MKKYEHIFTEKEFNESIHHLTPALKKKVEELVKNQAHFKILRY